MATIVLTAIGSGIGSGAAGILGAAVGGALGSYLDKEFLFPAPDIEQPRVGDLRTQLASEAMPLNYAIGPEVRVAGKVVYVGPEFPLVVDDIERADVLIDICQGPIEEDDFLVDIWANGQRIYQSDPDISFTTGTYTASMKVVQGLPSIWLYRVWLTLSSEDQNVDLTALQEGYDVLISGLDDPTPSGLSANGTWRVRESFSSPGSPPSTTVVFENLQYDVGALYEWGQQWQLSVTTAVEVNQDLPVFSGNLIQNVRLYRGTDTQEADPTIVVQRGTGNVPARHGRASVMLVGLNKTKFGSQVPNFEIQFRERASMTVAEAIDELMLRQGFDRGLWDSSGVTGSFRGLVAEEPIDSKGLLQIVMQAYGVTDQEVEGKVVFRMKDQLQALTVDPADLAAHSSSDSQQSRLIEFEDRSSRELPTRVELIYNDSDRNLQQASVRETHSPVSGALEGRVARVRTPLTLTEAEAGAMARQIMLDAYAGRLTVSTSLPPAYLDLAEGDIWETTLDGKPVRAVAKRVELGANGVVRLAGTSYQPQIGRVSPAEVDAQPSEAEPEIPLSLYLELEVVDSVPLTDLQSSTVGAHWAILETGGEGAYGGGELYQQTDGVSYDLADELPPPQQPAGHARIESATNVLTGLGVYWDRMSEFTVRGVAGWAPSSSTEAAVLSGSNRAFLGNELLGYVNATDNGDGTYTISTLLRALNGSLTYDSSGASVLVPASAFQFNDQLPSSSIGSAVMHKAVGVGWSLEQVSEVGVDFAGRSVRPAWVHSIRGHRDASDNIELSWRRQARRPWPIFSGEASLDQPDTVERYKITILNAFGVEATTSPVYVEATADADGRVRWTYTAAAAGAETGLNFGPALAKRFVILQVGFHGEGFHGNSITVPVGVGLSYSDA
jgi:hypothetical protein